MAYNIKTQDGIILKDIPDNIPKDDPSIIQKIKEARAQNNMPEPVVEAPMYNRAAEAVRSGAGGTLLGFADELEAALRTGKISGDEYTQLRNELRSKQEQYATDYPKEAMATNIGGSFLTPLGVAGTGAKGGMSLFKNIGLGTGLGAAQGIGSAGEEQNTFDEALKGGVVGGGATGVLHGLGRIIAPLLAKGAPELAKEGIRLTPGQAFGGSAKTLEESSTSIPFFNQWVKGAQKQSMTDFNVAVMNKALKPIGESLDKNVTGYKAVLDAGNKISNKYTEILPKMKLEPNQELISSLDNVIAKNSTGELSPDQLTQLTQYVNGVKSKIGNETVTGEKVKLIANDLREIAGNYRGASGTDKMYGDAVYDVEKAFKNNLQKQNPKYASELKNVDESYATFVRVQDAVRSASRQGTEPIFSPTQLLASINKMDTSLRKGAISKEQGLLQEFANKGVDVMGNVVPDTGTAGRLGILGALTAAGSAINPKIAIPAGLLSSLYTDAGQKYLMPLLLKERPEFLQQVGQRTAKAAPFASTALLDIQNQLYGNQQ
jgi:hypothetical protein